MSSDLINYNVVKLLFSFFLCVAEEEMIERESMVLGLTLSENQGNEASSIYLNYSKMVLARRPVFLTLALLLPLLLYRVCQQCNYLVKQFRQVPRDTFPSKRLQSSLLLYLSQSTAISVLVSVV